MRGTLHTPGPDTVQRVPMLVNCSPSECEGTASFGTRKSSWTLWFRRRGNGHAGNGNNGNGRV